jgi:ABC-2 type transport system permease protein
MMVYVFIAGAVSKFVNTGVEGRVNDDIHTGALAKYLTMPASYLGFRLACSLGEKLFAMVVLLLLTGGVIAGFYLAGLYTVNIVSMLLFIPAIFLGLVLNFFLFILISFSAFWITEAGRLFHSVSVIVMVISGGVFPVDIFGPGIKRSLEYLPFTYTIGFPIRAATGNLSTGAIGIGLLTQVFWILVVAILGRVVWAAGNKKFTAVGG